MEKGIPRKPRKFVHFENFYVYGIGLGLVISLVMEYMLVVLATVARQFGMQSDEDCEKRWKTCVCVCTYMHV